MSADSPANENAGWGRTVETAACERWGLEFVANGTPRRGRWWLAKRSHERLIGNDGEYALAVYAPDEGVMAMVLRPAWWVESLVTAWSAVGPAHYASRAAQIPWSRVFAEGDDGLRIVNNTIQNSGVSA